MKKEKKERVQFDFEAPPNQNYLHPYRDGDRDRILELVSSRQRNDGDDSNVILLWQDWKTRELFTSLMKGSTIIPCTFEMSEWVRYRVDEYPSGKRSESVGQILEAEGYAACESLLQQFARGQAMGMKCESVSFGKDSKGIVVGKLMLKKGGKHATKV